MIKTDYHNISKLMYTISSIILALSITGILTACDGNLRHSVDAAAGNKYELEKVLDYFKASGNPLKLKAAKFLIENMPYHGSFAGYGIESYDSAYLAMAENPIHSRDSIFRKLTEHIQIQSLRQVSDIHLIKAEYLIDWINSVCDLWNSCNWHNQYDNSIFFDYVLPYRLLNEEISEWRECVASEYPSLRMMEIRSKRGVELEAESGHIKGAEIVAMTGASRGEIVLLERKGSMVMIRIKSTLCSRKSIQLRYSSPSEHSVVRLILNGRIICDKHLDPSNGIGDFRDSKTGMDIDLIEGENEITFENIDGVIGIDYIMLSAVEPFDEEKCENFSKNVYRIRNKASGHYVTFDTLRNIVLEDLSSYGTTDADRRSKFCFDYMGSAMWCISPAISDSIRYCMEVKYCSLKENDPIGGYEFLNGNHQKWVVMALGDGSYKIMGKDSGLFLESVNNNGTEEINQTFYADRDSQKWILEKSGVNSRLDVLFPYGSAVAEALKVYDVTNQFEWFSFKGNVPPKAQSLLRARTGDCRDEASFTVYLCRYLGIPSAVDFTPNWGNRSHGHSWSVVIKPNGKSTPFYMGCVPGDTVHYYHGYIKPKVYRHRFRLNREITKDLKNEQSVPELFRNADFIDVTDEYYITTDVSRQMPYNMKDRKIAYICVFDNRTWVPVHYGVVRNGKVLFKSMGRNIVYMSAVFDKGEIQPIGNPFLIDEDGSIKEIKADTTSFQQMKVIRKYPFFGKFDHFNIRMAGGRFQGSNDADFSSKNDLFVHDGLTDGNWYDVVIKDRSEYRYVRYLGPNGSYCNVNEIEFYSSDGKKLQGEIIGTRGINGKSKDMVFDGNILTGFHGENPDGHWVGLKLRQKNRIGRIRYIPRNDGNCIEVGDEYELYFWLDGQWRSICKKKAVANYLIFDRVPIGGLYVIRNLTKGHEERIFTYENGNQIWW